MPGPFAVGALAAGSAIAGNIWNAHEARKNREFQERMSSTAHQREVKDLRAAGINPMARHLGGASTPGGDRAQMEDAGGKGISSALQAKLIKAQTQLLEDQALKTRGEVAVMNDQATAGRLERFIAERESAVFSAEEARRRLPLALQRAQAEIEQMMSSAQAARARAVLDRAAETGALNVEQFERDIGEMGPAVRFFIQVLRGVRR